MTEALLVLRVIRGQIPLVVEIAPAFDYARASHNTELVSDTSNIHHQQTKAVFSSKDLELDLRYVVGSNLDNVPEPSISLSLLDLSHKGHKGPAITCALDLVEGQCVTFVLRTPPSSHHHKDEQDSADVKQRGSSLNVDTKGDDLRGEPRDENVATVHALGVKTRASDDPFLTKDLVQGLFNSTIKYWNSWIRQSTYQGSWKEAVNRSALALKLLIYEPTGAVVASPTFSLPEYIGGTRNWDYRYDEVPAI
ncbi:hypothetical protein HGRIS_005467 [Hohenbuehelia grisea]|uniref:GH15-like domain-containing protein n=1 Tax=Hohenbuehelia grisea TaxID=104357 RepID=A0ABR3JWY4_9AGAR